MKIVARAKATLYFPAKKLKHTPLEGIIANKAHVLDKWSRDAAYE
jgi:hypothetical protein